MKVANIDVLYNILPLLGDYKDAIVNAGKAFESTMKTICSKNGYSYDARKDTANTLIRHLFDDGLIPSYMQTHFHRLFNWSNKAIYEAMGVVEVA
ncbi:DUF7014 domain-containing protein [Lysinibacillus xylanilyticus]|uniref:DUF7014 domain-containing protein n=1 Tax=Lysinibacillus xylanilyticus TaxID=582475 RepID=UPI003CFD0D31